MRKKPPCKKDGVPCIKRELGCQDICPEFAEWKKEENRVHKLREAENDKYGSPKRSKEHMRMRLGIK